MNFLASAMEVIFINVIKSIEIINGIIHLVIMIINCKVY